MINKNNLVEIEEILQNKKITKVAMVAPSFITDFKYPAIINQLKNLGFKEVVEVTFGAKIVNREYHRTLKRTDKLIISSTCPGIVQALKSNPDLNCFERNLSNIDSPMVAMGKVCRKLYPKSKVFFISPCHMKKVEANNSPFVDYTLDYMQLKTILEYWKISEKGDSTTFDKLYNDYTKIYPLSGGLSKTAKLHKLLKKDEYFMGDGWTTVKNKLLDIKKNSRKYKNLKFLDVTLCEGGCIGGPCTNRNLKIGKKHKLVMKYMNDSLREKIPTGRLGTFSKIKGMKFKN